MLPLSTRKLVSCAGVMIVIRLYIYLISFTVILPTQSEQESSGDGPEGRSLFWFPSTQSEGMWTKVRGESGTCMNAHA